MGPSIRGHPDVIYGLFSTRRLGLIVGYAPPDRYSASPFRTSQIGLRSLSDQFTICPFSGVFVISPAPLVDVLKVVEAAAAPGSNW